MRKIASFVAMAAIFFGVFSAILRADDVFNALEEARLRVFESLYKAELNSVEKKRAFLEKNFESASEHDIYTFPNATIEQAYNAYAKANLNAKNGFSLPQRALPSENKAYKVEPTKNAAGYVVSYIWGNNKKKLTINSVQIMQKDSICAKEVLEFEQFAKSVVLKSNYEQYCFE